MIQLLIVMECIRRSSASCQEAGIYTNSNKLKEVEEKLNELKTIVANTKNIIKNSKSMSKNMQNAIRLGNAVVPDGEEEEAEEHCENIQSNVKTETISSGSFSK